MGRERRAHTAPGRRHTDTPPGPAHVQVLRCSAGPGAAAPSVRPSLRPAPTFRPPPPPRSLRGAAPRRGAVRGRAGPRGDKALTYVGVAEGLLRVDGRAAARVGRAGPAEQQHRQPGQQAGQRGPGHRAAAAAQRRVPESLIHRRPGRAAHPPIRRRKVWVRRRGPPSGFAGAAAAAALRCLLWRCFLPLAAAKPRFLMCSGDSLLLLCMARGQPVSAPAPRRIRLRAELSPPARPGPARASRHGRGPSAVHPGRCLGADGAAQRRDRAGSAPGVGRRHGTRARLTALAPGPRRAEQQIAGRAALCLCPSISSPSCSSSSSPPAAPLPPPPHPPRFPRSPSAAHGALHLRRAPLPSGLSLVPAARLANLPIHSWMLPVCPYLSHNCASASPSSQRGQPRLCLCPGARGVWVQLSRALQMCCGDSSAVAMPAAPEPQSCPAHIWWRCRCFRPLG